MIRLAVLISGRGSNLLCLVNAIEKYKIKAEISIVISNKDCAGIVLAKKNGLATHTIQRGHFDKCADHESAITTAIIKSKADYIFLAGYMPILGKVFVQQFLGKIVNIHPSLLPAFKGLNTHQRAIDQGVKTHGVSVHLVTVALDDGPLIVQASLALSTNEKAQGLAKRVLKLEHQIYPFVLFCLAKRILSLSPDGAKWNSARSAIKNAPQPIKDALAPCLIWPQAAPITQINQLGS